MPVSFLSIEQRENHGRYTGEPSTNELARYFHLDDTDRMLIAQKRGAHNWLGFAVQLCTARYLGTFLEDPLAVPPSVLSFLAQQLYIEVDDNVYAYSTGEQRWRHATEIRQHYGYVEFTEQSVGFCLTRWLYALCWTGTDRPSILFERAINWLLTHKVLLPNYSTLERYIARLRSRVEIKLWRSMASCIDAVQASRLDQLLIIPVGSRNSLLDQLRTGPIKISSVSLVQALHRLKAVRELFNGAMQADKKVRQRTLKDLDQAAEMLATACRMVLDEELAGAEFRSKLFSKVPRELLAQAVDSVTALIRPANNVYFNELDARFRRVRRFLPTLLEHISFGTNIAAEPLAAALAWIKSNLSRRKPGNDAPQAIISKPWKQHVLCGDGSIDFHAYTFCALKELQTALKKRDVFVTPSWRYADPRAGLLEGSEWVATRPIICRTLGLSATSEPVLNAMADELDLTYRAVVARLPDNPAVRFKLNSVDKQEIILSPLDALDEPPSMIALRNIVTGMLPRVELPELILEIASRTGFTNAFTHVSERSARAEDLHISICAILMAEACNTGLEPFIRNDVPALRRDRLVWVDQNYKRDETIRAANTMLVTAQSQIPLASWGGGEVASADGMRFVVPVHTVHATPNPKYFGHGRGVTWYNLMSNQFSGLNDIVVPGTLRDSLVLLAAVLEQQTDLCPTQIMTDTGAYSDVMFGLFRLLGYRFCPRLADIGGTRFWRIDTDADYGLLNDISANVLNLKKKVAPHWDDVLRLIGSLKLGRISALAIMRTLQVGDRPTRLAQAIAEVGRLDKTVHTLTYLDDENKRRNTLTQLNRGEGRHSVARVVFHGKRGELRQTYREGQEDQLGSLGLVLNMIVLWNSIYMDAALDKLRGESYPVNPEDLARLSPLVYQHINMQGRYSFTVPDAVAKGELRPFNEWKE
jgi:TnpA family transposase